LTTPPTYSAGSKGQGTSTSMEEIWN